MSVEPSAYLPVPQDYARCSACGLCLLVCPVWRRESDLMLTPLGRARALQHGASVGELEASFDSCTLCGACEPVCPENIALVEMTLALRRQRPTPAIPESARPRLYPAAAPAPEGSTLLPGMAMRANPSTLARAMSALGATGGVALAADDGDDIALALEAGVAVAETRLTQFLRPLRRSTRLIVAEGLLLRQLRLWLPRTTSIGLGEALSRLPALRAALRADDLYVIEPRAYHASHARLVGHYDALRRAAGCAFNLDLQRMAIPARASGLPQRLARTHEADAAQIAWILQGRRAKRIVTECMDDAAAFRRHCSIEVVHLADVSEEVQLAHA